MGVKPTEGSQTTLRESSTADETPPLRAAVFVLGTEEYRLQVTPLVPDKLTVREFGRVGEYVDAASTDIGLAVISAEFPDEQIERTVRATLSTSRHAGIALIATDGEDLLQCDVSHDEAFVLPEDRDELRTAIRHLYVRAYYSVTLERYYDVCLAIQNRKLTSGDDDPDELAELHETRDRLQRYFRQFRGFLDAEDFDAIATRESRFEDLTNSSRRGSDPSAIGLPESCPDCDLDWTSWHGSRLKSGYERIGANTYRCTGCGRTIADGDPDNYRIG